MTDETTPELLRLIATSKARWTAGDQVTEELIEQHMAMPSNVKLASDLAAYFTRPTMPSEVTDGMQSALRDYFREVWGIYLEPHAWEEALLIAIRPDTLTGEPK